MKILPGNFFTLQITEDSQMMRTEKILKTLVYPPFNNRMQLLARKSFIELIY